MLILQCWIYTVYLCLQGSYDTILHGCVGLDEGNVLRSLVTSNSSLSNATFSQQLFEADSVSSYLGHAVSVQNSSGAVIGCGRFETLFSVDASYRGKHILSQLSQHLPANLPDLSRLDIPQYTVLDGIAPTCSDQTAVFDPWTPGLQLGTSETNDQIPVGDLPNHSAGYLFVTEVPLIGSASILGHAVSSVSRTGLCLALCNIIYIYNWECLFVCLFVRGKRKNYGTDWC